MVASRVVAASYSYEVGIFGELFTVSRGDPIVTQTQNLFPKDKMMTTTTAFVERCPICGGTAGNQIPAEGHYLCQELVKLGLPTPSLGYKCPDCKGSGREIRDISGVLLPLNPTGRALELWFPKCQKCNGTGTLDKEEG
jgi:hypothetical protein